MTDTDKTAEHLQIVREALRVARDNADDTNEVEYYSQALSSIEALEEFLNNQPKGN